MRLSRSGYNNLACSILTFVLAAVSIFLYLSSNNNEVDYNVILKEARYSNLDVKNHVSKLISDFSCSLKPIKLLIIVTSNVTNFDRRQVIRNTWGRSVFTYRNRDFRTFFAVGKSRNNVSMTQIERESIIYKDVIMGDYYENFFNLSFKIETIFEWAYKHCKFDYLLKVDDDVYINLSNIFHLLNRVTTPRKKLYMGNAQYHTTVEREGKNAVSLEEYSKNHYPPYCPGGAVLFSHDVVADVIPYFWPTPFRLDDIYLAILIANTGIKPIYESTFRLTEKTCKYDDTAVALHFMRRRKGIRRCMLELFYTMMSANVENTFTSFHYIPRAISHD